MGGLPFGVDGSYEKKDKEGITRATVGAGTLNVQDKTKQAELENTSKTQKLANINRDLKATQEITKDERQAFKVYVTDTSIKRVVEAAETVGEVFREIANSIAQSLVDTQQYSANTVRQAERALDAVIEGKLTIKQLRACANQQGFNVWDLLVSPAHASQCGGFSVQEAKACLDLLSAMKNRLGQWVLDDGAAFIASMKAKYEKNPREFEGMMALLDLPEILVILAVAEFGDKDPGQLWAEYEKGRTKLFGASAELLSEQFAKLERRVERGEISATDAAFTTGILSAIGIKFAPKKLKGKIAQLTSNTLLKLKSFATRGTAKSGQKLLPAPKPRGRSNTAPQNGTIYVDSKGNALVTPPGGAVTGSPDGRYLQARDAAGKQTGTRIDAGHNPKGHPDPRAQKPHGHVPGVTNPDETPWLPIN